MAWVVRSKQSSSLALDFGNMIFDIVRNVLSFDSKVKSYTFKDLVNMGNATINCTAGDTFSFEGALLLNGQPIAGGISGYTVTAALTNMAGNIAVLPATTMTIVDSSACVVSVMWSALLTASLAAGSYLLEVELTNGTTKSTCYRVPVRVLNGAI